MALRFRNTIRHSLGCLWVTFFQFLQVGYAQQPVAPVQWIDTMPVIDGILDNELSYLEQRKFNYFWRFDNPPADTVKVSYRIGYTSTHLIYHGRKDGALPVKKAILLAQKLRSVGSIVTERIIDHKAHEYPDEETNQVYFHWLKRMKE